jgi:hypothetical protein
MEQNEKKGPVHQCDQKRNPVHPGYIGYLNQGQTVILGISKEPPWKSGKKK